MVTQSVAYTVYTWKFMRTFSIALIYSQNIEEVFFFYIYTYVTV